MSSCNCSRRYATLSNPCPVVRAQMAAQMAAPGPTYNPFSNYNNKPFIFPNTIARSLQDPDNPWTLCAQKTRPY